MNDDRVYRRNEDVETSHESAAQLQPQAYWLRILDLLIKQDRPQGWTAYEIERALPGLLGDCPWHRVSDVRREGWADWAVDESGHVIKRPGGSSRNQRASRVTTAGRKWRQENLQGALF